MDTCTKCRCPDTANVSDWRDKQGAFHRLIEHQPIKGVTSDMLRWFLSPALAIASPLVPFRGEVGNCACAGAPLSISSSFPVPFAAG